jgi:hypothetical protein
MAALCQLSYVGTVSNPSGPTAHQVMLARRAGRQWAGWHRRDRVWSITDVLVLWVGFVIEHVERDSGRRDDRQRDPSALAVSEVLE